MFSIFICEDDSKQREYIEKLVFDYISHKDADIDLALSTANPAELLAYVEQHPDKQGLYFLDIDLQHELNGIVLASKIRKYDRLGYIVFVTTHAELSYLTFRYKVEAMDYIIKDNSKDMADRVRECIEVVFARMLETQSPRSYQVKIGTRIHHIPLHEITVFESNPTMPGKIILYTKHDRLEFYGTLSEIAKSNPAFFRCHQSFVVNTKNVKHIDASRREVTMIDGSIAFVAVRKMKELTRRIAE